MPLGGSALSRAVQSGTLDPDVAVRVPATAEAWRARAEAVRRAAPAEWLAVLAGAFGAADQVPARLARTAEAGGIVITTGQQAGLFGGPVYTWSKAIGALALADAVERATGIATAPVFWAATDDADYVEASRTSVLDGGEARLLEATTAPASGTPMALAALGDALRLLGPLRDACASMAYEPAYAAVAGAYVDGETVGGAYVRLLRALLAPLGIAVLDASHAAVRSAGAPVLLQALERSADVASALAERHRWLDRAGFEPQVADVAALSTVFVQEGGVKRRVPIQEARTVRESADAARLGPNVLLRPVMERAILPTAAYVAGPGELAYFAQVSAVAQALGAAEPLALPRWSCTIVEPAVDRALSRLGLGMDDVGGSDALERRLARAAVPEEVLAAMAALRDAVREGLAAVAERDAADPQGPLLTPAITEGVERRIGFRLDRLERRAAAAAKRRGSDALRDLRTVHTALRPFGHPQERTLNFIPFLARYGPGLWQAMREAAGRHAQRLVGGSAE